METPAVIVTGSDHGIVKAGPSGGFSLGRTGDLVHQTSLRSLREKAHQGRSTTDHPSHTEKEVLLAA